ncbi:hypothetical protein AUC68_06915 [Methyloceanibacter methanicus]|uniref:Formylmethanofuran dehydrogenase subunit B n=1 Tax=Methyloceanibacter methanicus TaxID=1774968 RepID=A0A1E3VZF6_9HYPH|nr:hypothetical protein AUC68_06915 [Methyloceanibacter methanicus]
MNGAAAALALAQKLGGVVDHAASEGMSRAARVMRETGSTPASFGEVRNRADTIVLIGDSPRARDPELLEKLFPAKALPRPGDNARELVVVGAKKGKTPAGLRTTEIDGKTALPELVASLGAAIRELPFEIRDAALAKKILSTGKRLRESAFAVFVYDPAEIEEPVLHTVLEAVRHLVKTTRAATLSLAAPGNGEGVNLCSTWTCGLPVRTSFAGETPENNMWAFETERLLKSGEADALVWIDALDGADAAPPTRAFRGISSVVLSSKPVKAGRDDVVVEVGAAVADHDAAVYLPPIAGIGEVKATSADASKPTVADVLNKIGTLIDAKRAA